MTPQEFIKEIKGKGKKPLYVIRGSEPLGQRACLEAARGLLGEDVQSFSFFTFHLGEESSEDILNAAASGSLFSSAKVLNVRIPESYKMTAGDSENFLSLLTDKNSENLTLLFWEKPDERTKFMKGVKELKTAVDCPIPDKKGMPAWLIQVFKGLGITLSGPMANLILERAGDNPGTLLAEAEKLAIYPGPGKALTAKQIKEYVSLGPVSVIYELADPLGDRNIARAAPILLDLLESCDNFALLRSVGNHLRRLYELKIFLMESQLNGDYNPDVAGAMKLHPFVAQKYKTQAGRWTLDELITALDKTEKTQKLFVTSPVPPRICLEEFIFDITLTASQKKEVKKSV